MSEHLHSRDYKVIERVVYRDKIWPKGRIIRVRNSTAKKLIQDGKIIPIPQPKFRDVMRLDIKLPETVIILGSGPRGNLAHARIQADDFVISCNAAINCPVHTDLWMAMDPSLHEQDYFFNAMRSHYDRYYLKGCDLTENGIGHGYPIPVMERIRVARYFPWVNLVFELKIGPYREYMMKINDVIPAANYLRPGATIAAAAVQFCYWKGVKNVRLCGIDMFGDVYFDGSKHKKRQRKGITWPVVPIFNALMRHLENQGMAFTTMSETKLDVKTEV